MMRLTSFPPTALLHPSYTSGLHLTTSAFPPPASLEALASCLLSCMTTSTAGGPQKMS